MSYLSINNLYKDQTILMFRECYALEKVQRVIAKHKGEAFEERATPQKVVDPDKLKVLESANAIAQEWVTEMRLAHVLDKIEGEIGIERTGEVIRAMVEDVYREAKGEIVESREAQQAIGKRTALLFKERLKAKLSTSVRVGPKQKLDGSRTISVGLPQDSSGSSRTSPF